MENDFSQFLSNLKSRILVSDVVGQHVRLKRQGREWKGLSPFTNEKSPSFTVNDQKQFWHCFSSGEHGDVISFLMKTQNLTFIEAVDMLAARAGLEVPKRRKQDPVEVAKAKSALDALLAARDFFESSLGKESRALLYLTERGLTSATIKKFHLGYSPSSSTALRQHLKDKGFSDEHLFEAGLLVKPEGGGTPYDRFRNRIMFPIDNRKGEIIGFGARALDSKAQAKYLNSPETSLFHKGDNFYGLSYAAKTAYDKGQLVIVEGYMDVIALHQAGCDYAVASLGTALTENQVELAWRFADEPIVCLDGDEAGQRASGRVIERALKILRAGKSLRFAYMPKGKDPDDVVRTTGLEAFEQHIQQAESMSDSMFYKESNATTLETPERRAALRQRFDRLINEIKSPEVQRYYRDLFHRRLEKLFWRTDRTQSVAPTNIAAPAIVPDGASGGERVLLGMMIDQPQLLQKYAEDLEKVYLASEPHQHLRDALMLANEENASVEAPSVEATSIDAASTAPSFFYEKLGEPYHYLLDLIYGRDGHSFYRLFPAFQPVVKEHHREGFAEQCLRCFIHEQYHHALQQDCVSAHRTYQASFGETKESEERERWLKIKMLLEEDEVLLLDEITSLSTAIDELSTHIDYASGFLSKNKVS